MLLVWAKGEGTIREYYESGDRAWPYTTFASTVKNLERKGYLRMRRIGTTNLCTPLIGRNEYRRHFMSDVVRSYFQDSYREVVSFFAREEKISAEELKEIIRIIEKR